MATAIPLETAPPPRSPRPRPRARPAAIPRVTNADGVVALYQQLAAVIDRPAAPFQDVRSDCRCAECNQQRAAAFACDNCGFRGTPVIHGCTCTRSALRGMIAYYQDRLRTMHERGVDGLAGDCDTRARVEQVLDELRESAVLVRHGEPCIIRQAAASSPERTGQTDDCSHGLVECPCCGGGAAYYDAAAIDPWQRIREIRAVMRALRPAIAPYADRAPATP